MRIIGFSLLALLFLGGMLWLGSLSSVEIHGRSLHEASFEKRASGKRFLVPYEHSLGAGRNPLWDVLWDVLDFFWGSEEEPSSFFADFHAAWISAHVDGFQPILNDQFESTVTLVQPTRDNMSFVRPIDVDLWYGRDPVSDRIVLEQREPTTGMQMIVYPHLGVIDPFSDGASIYLIDTPPRPDRDYPQDPPWRVQICRHGFPGMIKALGYEVDKFTFCNWSFHAIDGVTFGMDLSGENLPLRSEMGHAAGREIMHWMLMAAELPQPREQP